jgi:choline dehydrogenase
MSSELTADYVVVGAGSSGCVVTHRLVTSGGGRVVLLEAGGPDTNPAIHDPRAVLSLWGSDVDWKYMTEPQAQLGGRQVFISRGKVLGGSSAIYAMLYVRGNQRDYDHWGYLGNEGWSYDTVLPYFMRSERNSRGASKYHGGDGPMDVRDNPTPSPVAKAFPHGCVELGFKGPDWDYNGPVQEEGAGLYQVNITPEGKRCSAAVAFLRPIQNRSDLQIVTGAQASKILIEKGRAVGIEFVKDGKVQRVRAEKEVIVSAGAFDSPKLLMLSGLGPAEHLKANGVGVVVDLPGVGQNLQDHLLMPVFYNSKIKMDAPMFIAEAALFTRTRKGMDSAAPDLQYHFSAGIPAFNPPGYDVSDASFVFVPILVKPQSRGEVKLRSSNAADLAVVKPNYLQSDTDLQVLEYGVKLAREIAQTKAFKDFTIKEAAPGTDKDPAALREYIRTHCSTVWHVAGTCRMGRDRMGVVDPQLRVHGVQGLRVADASIMPDVVAGNTHAACVMIGERCADLVMGRTTATAAAAAV